MESLSLIKNIPCQVSGEIETQKETITWEDVYPLLDFSLVGKYLAFHRNHQRLNQVELAQKAGVDQATVSRVESGTLRPRKAVLMSICEELGVCAKTLAAQCSDISLSDEFLASGINVSPIKRSSPQKLQIIISEKRLTSRIAQLAWSLMRSYPTGGFEIVALANAGVIFASRLLLELEGDMIGFNVIKPNKGDNSLKFDGIDSLNLVGRNVVLVDSICRSGETISAARAAIETLNPARVVTCVLIDQPELRRDLGLSSLDFVGFVTDPLDVFGFGLDDADERNRNLRDIVWSGDHKSSRDLKGNFGTAKAQRSR